MVASWRNGFGSCLLLAGLLLSTACESSCEEVARQLRDCCAKGPQELRARCESEADELEADGNGEACESVLDRDKLARCGQ